MRKTHRKIVSGALLCGCALFTLYGASRIAERAENGALPVAITDLENEKPVIIIDAGQDGNSTMSNQATGIGDLGLDVSKDALLKLREEMKKIRNGK